MNPPRGGDVAGFDAGAVLRSVEVQVGSLMDVEMRVHEREMAAADKRSGRDGVGYDLVECASFPKGLYSSNYPNEDGFVLTDYAVAVFDGVTDKAVSVDGNDTVRTDGMAGDWFVVTPGRAAVEGLVRAVQDVGDTCDPLELVDCLHEAVATAKTIRLPNGGDAMYLDDCAAVGAVLHVPSRRIVRVGDISVGVDGWFTRQRLFVERIAAEARGALLLSCLDEGRSVEELVEQDVGRSMVLPLLRAQSRWQNREDYVFGHAVLNGSGTPPSMIDVIELPDESVDVVLATDGYPEMWATLAETERALAERLEDDPLHLGPPPGTKGKPPWAYGYDDRTFVRVTLGDAVSD